MTRDRSKIYPMMGESERTTKVFKTVTVILFSLILIGALLFLIRDNAGVTGFAVFDFKNSNYCTIKDNSVAPFVKPNIDCTYVDNDETSVTLRFVNNNVEQGKKFKITSIKFNDCVLNGKFELTTTGDVEEVKIECEEINSKNSVEVTYMNLETGLSFGLDGEVRIYS